MTDERMMKFETVMRSIKSIKKISVAVKALTDKFALESWQQLLLLRVLGA